MSKGRGQGGRAHGATTKPRAPPPLKGQHCTRPPSPAISPSPSSSPHTLHSRPAAYDRPPAPPPAPPPLYGGTPGPGGPVPPPPPRGRSFLDSPPSARTLLTSAVLGLVGGALWWAALFGHDPVKLAVDDRTGVVYATTAGGAKVLISQEEDGSFVFVDQAGDLYYQAGGIGRGAGGDGFYIVDPQNNIYNSFYDEDGERKLVSVGRMDDIVSFKPGALGGVPADRLAALVGDRDAGRFTAIYSGADGPDDPLAVQLPPNAPVEVDADGRATGPVALDEGVMLLQQKKGLFGRTPKSDRKDPLDAIAAMSDRAEALQEEYARAAKAGVKFENVKEAPALAQSGDAEEEGEAGEDVGVEDGE